jgi:methionyl aminopeptidase
MIPLKSESELDKMRKAGKIIAGIMRELQKVIKPGLMTSEIDLFAEELIARAKVKPAFKGYKGYPATVCTSINEEIVHGLPSDRKLKEGDLIKIDIGITYDGYFVDMAASFPVGKINAQRKRLLDVTRDSLAQGIRQARADKHLYDISYAIQNYVEGHGFSVVRQFVGHGIGKQLHEEPEIPNFGKPHQGPALKNGMVFAIEPMVNLGTWESEIEDNGWTAVTKDKQPSAHFEHTVAITPHGPEILTQLN